MNAPRKQGNGNSNPNEVHIIAHSRAAQMITKAFMLFDLSRWFNEGLKKSRSVRVERSHNSATLAAHRHRMVVVMRAPFDYLVATVAGRRVDLVLAARADDVLAHSTGGVL